MTFQHADTTHHCELKFFMYLVAIGWLYVALMMAVAEANHPSGTVLGGIVTFLFYGLLPTALVMYLMGTPLRRKANREKEAKEDAERLATAAAAGGTAEPLERDARSRFSTHFSGKQATVTLKQA
jgi:uncharacterized membrane protein